MTAVAGSVFTAAQFNQYVRDLLNETAPAKAVTPGGYFVTSGTNSIAERSVASQFVTTLETTSSTAYADMATVGPTVSVTTGTAAIVAVCARIINNTAGQNTYASYEISGASSVPANDDNAFMFTCPVANYSQQGAHVVHHTGLTPGVNTFTMKYRVTGGTGTGDNRRIIVLPL